MNRFTHFFPVLVMVFSVFVASFVLPARAIEFGSSLTNAISKKWTGDYDGMLKRRAIRVMNFDQ